ncbi:MAG: hypothetical protein K2L47_03325, partial [Clostridia bacterium]|nr:hypothetical protein [Clostridia bacterium]
VGAEMCICYRSLTKLSFINIWKKKWRLLVTAVLFFFTLTMFGIAISAFRYDEVNIVLTACYDNGLDEFKLQNTEHDYMSRGYYTASEIEEFKKHFPKHKLDFLYALPYERALDIEGLKEELLSMSVAPINNDILSKYGYDLCYGKLPSKVGEICLSKYVAKDILDNKLIKGVTDYASLGQINLKILTYPDLSFKVVGIVDTKIDDLYNRLDMPEHLQESSLREELRGSYTSAVMVSEDFVKDYYLNEDVSCRVTYWYSIYDGFTLTNVQSPQNLIFNDTYAKLATEQNGAFGEIFYKQGKTSLSGKEIIVSHSVISNMVGIMLSKSTVTNSEILT